MLTTMFSTDVYIAQYPNVSNFENIVEDILQHLPFSRFINDVVSRCPPFPPGIESTVCHWFKNDPNHPPERLHEDPRFIPIAEWILEHAKIYWQQLGYSSSYEPAIEKSWIQRYHGGCHGLHVHNHPGMPISASFYFDASPEQGNYVVEDPLDILLGQIPYLPQGRNFRLKEIPIKTGQLIIVPGWLRHSVMPNTTDRTRYTWNMDFFGKKI